MIKFKENTGIMICGHGSRDQNAVRQFAHAAQKLQNHIQKKTQQNIPFEYGYLEFAQPIINTGLDKLKQKGVKNILAIPAMLFAAGHAKNDIPSVLNTYARKNKNINVTYGKELGIDPKMIRAAADRIRTALNDNHINPNDKNALHQTLLVVVGRGASDPDANANVAKITRMLWEGFGFGWAETAYSGVTFPLVEAALKKSVRLGFQNIVIFPYFLFTGILIKRIYQQTDLVAQQNPNITFIKAPYLNDHPNVIETLANRLTDIENGNTHMNCSLCKYREQILGFEDEIGLPQQSHHHHVEGISGNHHEHHHHTHHQHNHTHHHPYPHRDHPDGPLSMQKDKDHI